MRNLCIATFALAGVILSVSPAAAQLPPACKATFVVVSTIAENAIAVPDEFKADIAAGTLRLEVRDFLTGKVVPGGGVADLTIDWKARGGQWDAASAASVLQLLSKTPNSILVWSGSTQPTCHQDVLNPVPTKIVK
jgi:hypothetical protein